MARVAIIILMMLVSAVTNATPAYPYPIEVRQPDGSTVYMLLKGDENLRYRTSLMGDRMVKNEKGYYVPTFKAPKPASTGTGTTNATPMAGSISTLIIPVQFQDIRFSIKDPKTHFNNMMNSKGYSENNATGSVKDYFDDNLKGFIRVTFDVSNIVTLDREMSYYGENKEDDLSDESVYDWRVQEMIREACLKINPETNFAKYQYIFVYYAGYSEAEGGDPDTIWPASLDLSSSPISLDGTSITKVGFASELRGATGKTPSGIGAFCHEFGHILGFKDLYDADYEENGRSKGMWGTLSLMDYGCYNNQGRTPPYFNAIEWEALGFQGKRLSNKSLNTLEPININSRFFRVDTHNEGEYYLLENRVEKGWDSFIGGSGMLIYHIDKSSNSAGTMEASMRWKTNLINACSEHECADLVEAVTDAANVKQVFFPGIGNVTSFATLTDPHFVAWDKRGVGIKLTDIKIDSGDDNITFMVDTDDDEILLAPASLKTRVDQTEVEITWDTSMDMDAKWGIRWRMEKDGFRRSDEMVVEERSCTIDNLKPGQAYECQIFHIGYKKNGDTTEVRFKTLGVTSPFPYIEGIRKVHKVGDTIQLKIYNLSEIEEDIKWYLNDMEIDGGKFVFEEAGVQEIKAKIRYVQDGSTETLYRKISIHEEDNTNQEVL